MVVGFALGGGGAKGSFQLGAIDFLYSRGIRPDIIIGTSVGSINGVKLAEGEGMKTEADGYPSGFVGLKQIWMELTTTDDMYVKDPALDHLPEELKKFIEGKIEGAFYWTLGLTLVPGVGHVISAIIGSDAEEEVEDAIKKFLAAKGMYSLSPIESLMTGARDGRKRIKLDTVQSSKISFFATILGLGTSKLRYVSKDGSVYEPNMKGIVDFNRPYKTSPEDVLTVDLIDAIMASSAIPLAFTPRKMLGELQFDGGVRKVISINATIDAGANEVYAILCSAPFSPYIEKGSRLDDIEPGSINVEGEKEPMDLLTIIERSVYTAVDENIKVEVNPRFNWPVPVNIIQPHFNVHSTQEIDAGLIRISWAYGYMRAFEVLNRKFGPRHRLYLSLLSDLIASSRAVCRREEKAFWIHLVKADDSDLTHVKLPWNIGFPTASWLRTDLENKTVKPLRKIRQLKCFIQSLVNSRYRIAGRESLPDDDVNRWGEDWEAFMSDTSFPTFSNPFVAQRFVVQAVMATKQPPTSFYTNIEAAESCPDEFDKIDLPFRPHNRSSPNGTFIESDWCSDEIITGRNLPDFTDHISKDNFVDLASMLYSKGNFEMLVPMGNRVKHYCRDNDSKDLAWHRGHDLPLPPSSFPHSLSDTGSMITGRVTRVGISALPGGREESVESVEHEGSATTFEKEYDIPVSISVFEGNFRNAEGHGNFEAVAHLKSPDGKSDYLVGYTFSDLGWAPGHPPVWHGPFPILVNGNRITGVTGRPVMFQSSHGTKGNFEMLVPMGNRVKHYWRDNDTDLKWHERATLPQSRSPSSSSSNSSLTTEGRVTDLTGISTAVTGINTEETKTTDQVSISFIQSNFRNAEGHGNFEAVAHLKSPDGKSDYLASYYFDASTLKWHGPFPILVNGNRITGVTGRPVMFQSSHGTKGNFEMLVPMGNRVKHYWSDNDSEDIAWYERKGLPRAIHIAPKIPKISGTTWTAGRLSSGLGRHEAVEEAWEDEAVLESSQIKYDAPVGVACFEGNFREKMDRVGVEHVGHGNFEAVAHLKSPDGKSDYLASYYFDASTLKWHGPFPILVNGNMIEGVTQF